MPEGSSGAIGPIWRTDHALDLRTSRVREYENADTKIGGKDGQFWEAIVSGMSIRTQGSLGLNDDLAASAA